MKQVITWSMRNTWCAVVTGRLTMPKVKLSKPRGDVFYEGGSVTKDGTPLSGIQTDNHTMAEDWVTKQQGRSDTFKIVMTVAHKKGVYHLTFKAPTWDEEREDNIAESE